MDQRRQGEGEWFVYPGGRNSHRGLVRARTRRGRGLGSCLGFALTLSRTLTWILTLTLNTNPNPNQVDELMEGDVTLESFFDTLDARVQTKVWTIRLVLPKP